MLRLSIFLLTIFSGSALPKKVWKSFRVFHDQTRMPLPAHSLAHQNQPRVYPPPTPVSFLPLHGSTWHSLCLEFSLSRWKSHFWQAASLLSWADYDLPMAVNPGLLPSSLHTCNYLGERAAMRWWAGGPVSRAGRHLFPVGHSDVLMANPYTSKKWHSLMYRMTSQDIICPFSQSH